MYVQTPNDTNYYAWQKVLRDLSLHNIEQTQKSMLYSKQKIFEYGNKNGRLLAWLARGQTTSTHIASIRDARGQLVSSLEDINNRFSEFLRKYTRLGPTLPHLNCRISWELFPFPH